MKKAVGRRQLPYCQVGEDTDFANPSYFTKMIALLLFLSQVKALGFRDF